MLPSSGMGGLREDLDAHAFSLSRGVPGGVWGRNLGQRSSWAMKPRANAMSIVCCCGVATRPRSLSSLREHATMAAGASCRRSATSQSLSLNPSSRMAFVMISTPVQARRPDLSAAARTFRMDMDRGMCFIGAGSAIKMATAESGNDALDVKSVVSLSQRAIFLYFPRFSLFSFHTLSFRLARQCWHALCLKSGKDHPAFLR